MDIYSFSQNIPSYMLKMTFHREISSQCTNTTNISASKPTQKLVYSKIFFYCSQCLYKYQSQFRGHIHKKMNKNDNLSHSILLRMLSFIFLQKQNRSTRFYGTCLYINRIYFLPHLHLAFKRVITSI